ncbi:MAG: type IV pilus modification protein PilV [Pseudomonadota bacterium]|nr:type IV pilus modification protein PilV [Pseudomonadota bacterium]
MQLISFPGRRRVQGYVLLEALVAVVVASVGFIGAARMQTVGMKMNTSSAIRQKAVLLTYQMTDRIRANRTGFGSGAYDNPAIGSSDCLNSGCSAAQLAVADMTDWTADIEDQLPDGSGVVCIDSTPNDGTAGAPACDGIGNLLAVKVWWTDSMGITQFVTVVRP